MTLKILYTAVFLYFSAASCSYAAEVDKSNPPIGMVTRYVKLFWGLEQSLQSALQRKDYAAANDFLSPDFEMAISSQSGENIPKTAWLENMASFSDQLASRSFLGFSVKELGGAFASVSYTWTGFPNIFVVDLWKKDEKEHWALFTRYAIPIATTDQPIPGGATSSQAIEKRI